MSSTSNAPSGAEDAARQGAGENSDGEVLNQEEDKEQLAKWLGGMWEKQTSEIEQINSRDAQAFKKPALPLARIKKIMKENEEVRMISGEAPLVFSKACELIISELAIYSWSKTDSSRRRTIKQGDVFECIEDNHLFDFLQMYFLDTGKMHGEGYVVEEESPKNDFSTEPAPTNTIESTATTTPAQPRQQNPAQIGYFPSTHSTALSEQRMPLSATDAYLED